MLQGGEVFDLVGVETFLLLLRCLLSFLLIFSFFFEVVSASLSIGAAVVARASVSTASVGFRLEFGEAGTDFFLIELFIDVDAFIIVVPVQFVSLNRVELLSDVFR